MDTENALYTDFPFKVNKHAEFVLYQLHTVHEEYGFKGSVVTVQAFSKDYPATIKTNHNAYVLLQYLESLGAIKIKYGVTNKIAKVNTPVKAWPVLYSVPEWELVITSQPKVDHLYNQVSFINNSFNKAAQTCSLAFADDKELRETLYLRTRQNYPLWSFNDSLTKELLKLLIGESVLTRKNGYVKLAKGELKKSPALHTVLKNAGFNKKLKDWFFTKCEADEVIMKPYTMLSGRDIDYVIATFQQKSKKIQKMNSQKSDFITS